MTSCDISKPVSSMRRTLASPTSAAAPSPSPYRHGHRRRNNVPLERQALGELVQMDLQVKFEKYRRRPDDWQLPLYDMKLNDYSYSKPGGSPMRRQNNRRNPCTVIIADI